MPAVVIDDGQFQIAVKRRGGYGLPLHTRIICSGKTGRFDLDQLRALPLRLQLRVRRTDRQVRREDRRNLYMQQK